jgi:hypothetical protein
MYVVHTHRYVAHSICNVFMCIGRQRKLGNPDMDVCSPSESLFSIRIQPSYFQLRTIDHTIYKFFQKYKNKSESVILRSVAP